MTDTQRVPLAQGRVQSADAERVHRLTVVCQEIPYPAIHGGRVDVWRRLEAFARAGVRIQLVTWAAAPPDASVRRALDRVCESWQVLTFKQTLAARLRTAVRVFSVPSPVGTRVPSRRERGEVRTAVRAFRPDAIWLDQLYGAELALDLAGEHDLPLLTRSHNIEHQYWRDQYLASRGLGQKLWIKARLFSLERFERAVLQASRYFYDISVEDLAYWASQGLQNGRWLPPLAGGALRAVEGVQPDSGNDAAFDIGFVGNLYMPNNVEAVRWLVQEVLPKVRTRLPGARALIAGTKPVSALRELIAGDPLTELRPDIADPEAIFRVSRVLVNPLLNGSGVALKSIDMLASGCRIVSTPKGVGGLPPMAKACFVIAETADAFAQAIVAQLTSGPRDHAQWGEAMTLFTDRAINVVLDDLQAIRASAPAPVAVHLAWTRFQRRQVSMEQSFGFSIRFFALHWRRRILKPLEYAFKALQTMCHCWQIESQEIWVQLPPLPLLAVVLLYRSLSGRNARIVADCHNSMLQKPWSEWFGATELLNRCDLVLVHNGAMVESARSIGIRQELIEVLEDAPASFPAIDAAAADVYPRPWIFYPGSLWVDEPLDELRRAAAIAREVTFVVTGDIDIARRHFNEENSTPNIRLAGYLPRAEFERLLFSADAVLAMTNREGIQLSVCNEAVGAAKPMVLSNTAILRTLFGKSSVLVDSADPASIARGCREAIRRKDELTASATVFRAERTHAWWTGQASCVMHRLRN